MPRSATGRRVWPAAAHEAGRPARPGPRLGSSLCRAREGAPVSQDGPPRGNRFPLPLARVGRAAVAPRDDVLRPQRHLHEAVRDAARATAPQGLGLDSLGVRERMVQRLRAEGIRCEPVFEAMRQVPRHVFVDTALAIQAYEDTSLPIGHGQTISKPSVVMIRPIDLRRARSSR